MAPAMEPYGGHSRARVVAHKHDDEHDDEHVEDLHEHLDVLEVYQRERPGWEA